MSCSIPGCENTGRLRRGWCQMHYSKWYSHGDPLTPQRKPPNGEAARYFSDVVMAYEGDECQMWPYARNKEGYGIVTRGDKPGMCLVSRRVCAKVHGPPPTPDHEAAHSCGHGKDGCYTKRHLAWKTHAENEADKLAHGTHNRGERSGNAKLTNAQAIIIKGLVGKQTDLAIARQFGVSTTTIREIRVGTRWRWLGQEVA